VSVTVLFPLLARLEVSQVMISRVKSKVRMVLYSAVTILTRQGFYI